MSYDPEAQRKIAKNWREYLGTIVESYRVYRWVWDELVDVQARRWVKRMVATLTVTLAFLMAMPWFIRLVFDGLVGKDAQGVITGLIGFVLCLAAMRLMDYITSICREWVLGLNMARRKQRTSELFFEKSLGQHAKHHDLLSASNVEKGLAKVSESQELMLFEGIEVLLTLPISWLFLWVVSPVAGAVMTVALIVHLFWSLYLNRRVVEVCTPLDEKFRKHDRYERERWKQIFRMKINAKEREELDKMDIWFLQILSHDRDFWMRFILHAVGRGTVTNLFVFIILVYGSWMVWDGMWQIGLLYPIFTWSTMMRDNLWRLSHVEHRLNWNYPAIASLREALTIEPDIVDRDEAIVLSPDEAIHLEISGITHAYEDGDIILRDVNLAVGPGQKVALLGLSGSGKSTLTKLVLREMDPLGGMVKVNGHDLRNIQLDSWLRLVGHIPQDAAILDGTLRYNLLYGLTAQEVKQVSDEQLKALMREIEIDFDRDGLETLVGEGGVKLSGGQQQRVMIGAAAMKRPRFMVIDEATSSLDAVTERKVHDGLHKVLTDDMGALIITHRLSTVRDLCDTFVVLRPVKGRLPDGAAQIEAIASSFEELYAVSPTFRTLADEQGLVMA